MSAVLAGGALSKLRCSYHECFCIFTHIPKKLLMVGSQYNTVQWKTNMHNVGVKYQRKRSCPLTRYALSLRCTLRHQWYNGTYMFVFDTTACFCVFAHAAQSGGALHGSMATLTLRGERPFTLAVLLLCIFAPYHACATRGGPWLLIPPPAAPSRQGLTSS